MLFDCVYAWAFTVSAAFVLAYFTDTGIHLLFAIVTFVECAKCFLGLLLVAKVKWARQLTADEPSAEQRI
jgi:Na+-driven multidrug efflux pump